MIKRLWLVIGTAILTALVWAPLARADVNSFRITDYNIDYVLGQNSNGESTLLTTETITADFPASDQNHGLERVIPSQYDGHTTRLRIQSVTDSSGQQLSYSATQSADSLDLRIGDADRYVHGLNTYVIKYTQENVTRYFSDTSSDEFYWDTNGVDWRVPIDNLTVRLTLDDGLSGSLTGNSACYRGVAGSNNSCDVKRSNDSGKTVFTTSASNLTAGENVTLAVGFKPQTFAQYNPSLWEKFSGIWWIVQIIGLVLLPAVIIIYVVYFVRLSNRSRELKPTPVEFIPPANASVTMSAMTLNLSGKMSTAQLIDLAVRHFIKIYEVTSEKSLFKSASKDYEIEIVRSFDSLRPEERELITDMVGAVPQVGDRVKLKALARDTKFRFRTTDNLSKFSELQQGQYNLRAKNPDIARHAKPFGVVILIVGLLSLSPAYVVFGLAALLGAALMRPLTDDGLVLKRYLLGLKIYIKAVEQEQFALLQTPEGADKVGVDTSDQGQMVKLYERNLPYAILFGQEKKWYAALGKYYENLGTKPDWFDSPSSFAAFNAASFASAMSSLSSASSSSSGGSSGSGSSGGGGGGGGGGGW